MSEIRLGTTPIRGSFAQPLDLTADKDGLLGIYVRDTVQRHAVGRQFISDLGSMYRYAGAGATLNTGMLAHSLTGQHMAYAAIAVAGSVGDTRVACTFGPGDGPGNDGEVAEDEMQGGSIILWPTPTSLCMNRTILHNTALASTGTIYFDLDGPINIALTTATSKAEAMANPYWSIATDAGTGVNRGRIGLPMVPAVSGEWCWNLTRGPCWITPANGFGNADPCSSAYNTQVVARGNDGSVQDHDSDTAETEYSQHIGFQLSRAYAGTQGAPFIMLQID